MGDRRGDPVAASSAELRHVYDDAYYRRHMAGHHLFAANRLTLADLTNVRRAYALVLDPSPSAVADVGAGRGELALHLLDGGAAVTLVDYSPAAIEIARRHVGDHPGARFVVGDAAELTRHVAAASQDAIFMTDVVEHMSSAELQRVFAACHACLAPAGVLAIHTPERHYGSVVTTAAVHRYHINLLEIASLRRLLAASFEHVDAFTWNGVEQFYDKGRCIELFAYARKRPYGRRLVEPREWRVASAGGSSAWFAANLAQAFTPPPRFVLRASLDVVHAPPDAIVQLIFATPDRDRFFWTGFHVRVLVDNPARLQIASEMTAAVGDPRWTDVDRIVLRVRAPGGGAFDIRIDDVRLLEHA